MYKCVIEAGKDVCHTKHIFPFYNLRAQRDLFLLLDLSFTWSHTTNREQRNWCLQSKYKYWYKLKDNIHPQKYFCLSGKLFILSFRCSGNSGCAVDVISKNVYILWICARQESLFPKTKNSLVHYGPVWLTYSCSQENLMHIWKCSKCGLYLIQHIRSSYFTILSLHSGRLTLKN